MKKQIREVMKYFSLAGMILICILMAIGIFIVSASFNGLSNYVIGFSFIGIGIYFWYKFFCNVFIKAKKSSLYLKEKKYSEYFFYDKKGKEYYFGTKEKLKVKEYYLVLKTRDYIIDVIDQSDDIFEITNIESCYWKNYYCVFGHFDSGFLWYVNCISLLYFLILIFYDNVIGFGPIFALVGASYFFIYDVICKINKKINPFEKVDDSALRKFTSKIFNFLTSSIILLFAFSLCVISFFDLIRFEEFAAKVLFLIIFFYCCSFFWRVVCYVVKNTRFEKVMDKFMILFRILFWISSCIYLIYLAIIEEYYFMIIGIVFFLLAGLYSGYKFIFKGGLMIDEEE